MYRPDQLKLWKLLFDICSIWLVLKMNIEVFLRVEVGNPSTWGTGTYKIPETYAHHEYLENVCNQFYLIQQNSLREAYPANHELLSPFHWYATGDSCWNYQGYHRLIVSASICLCYCAPVLDRNQHVFPSRMNCILCIELAWCPKYRPSLSMYANIGNSGFGESHIGILFWLGTHTNLQCAHTYRVRLVKKIARDIWNFYQYSPSITLRLTIMILNMRRKFGISKVILKCGRLIIDSGIGKCLYTFSLRKPPTTQRFRPLRSFGRWMPTSPSLSAI